MIRRVERVVARLIARFGHWLPRFGTPATLIVIALTLLVLANGQASANRQRDDIAQRQRVQTQALQGIEILVASVKEGAEAAKSTQDRLALTTEGPLNALRYSKGVATTICLFYRRLPPLPPQVSKAADCPAIYRALGLAP